MENEKQILTNTDSNSATVAGYNFACGHCKRWKLYEPNEDYGDCNIVFNDDFRTEDNLSVIGCWLHDEKDEILLENSESCPVSISDRELEIEVFGYKKSIKWVLQTHKDFGCALFESKQ